MTDAVKTILYFSYGSNMFTARLRTRTPSALFKQVGYVEGYKLAFDKVAKDGSAKCHIEPTGKTTDRVYGVVFTIAASEKKKLDEAEGLGYGYEERKIQVVTPEGIIESVTYYATKRSSGLTPHDWYKGFVVAGAEDHGLPAPYIAELRTVVSKPDPDKEQAAREEAILYGASSNKPA